MRCNQVRLEIKRALKEESFSELKSLIDLGFLYLNEDRGYIAIDVNSDAYREDSCDQTFIFTAEVTAEDDEECDNFWVGNYMAWDGEYGYSFGFDLNEALINAQKTASKLFDKYQ